MTVPPPEADPAMLPASPPTGGSDPPLRRTPPAAETLRFYRADWGAFATWCDTEGLAAQPADPPPAWRAFSNSACPA